MKRKDKRPHMFNVVVEKIDNGYFAYCPILTGVAAGGITYESALENLRLKLQGELEGIRDQGTLLPVARQVSLTFVEMAI